MREARIIIPQAASLKAHAWLRSELVSNFGGCTITQSYGAWKAPDGRVIQESVLVYDVACDEDHESDLILSELAHHAGAEAAQESVYWRDSYGNVHIDTLEKPATNVIRFPVGA